MSYTPPPPNAVDLDLSRPLPGHADLALGGGTPGDAFAAILAGRITLGMRASLAHVAFAEIRGRFGLRGALTAAYDNAVSRGVVAVVDTGFDRRAAEVHQQMGSGWTPGRATTAHHHVAYGEADATEVVADAVWRGASSRPACVALEHAHALWLEVMAGSRWGYGAALAVGVYACADNSALEVGHAVASAYGHAAPRHVHRAAPWHAAAAVHSSTAATHHRAASAHTDTRTAPWQAGRALTSSGGVWTFIPPRPPVGVVADLRLCASLASLAFDYFDVPLLLGSDPCRARAPLYILPARFYMAVHDLQAHLLPDLTHLPIFGVSMSADVGSGTWTFSANGPASLFDALAPSGGLPASLRITLDSAEWVFVVDGLQRTESFGQRGVRVSGRSATALVSSPYARETARINTTAANAQQLAARALDLTGVGLDWGIDDWLVPAGAWSHSGTPMAAVQAIAEAAGGYVNSHRSAPTLLVRHPYPTLPGGIPGGPWHWGGEFAADVELAPSALITTSIERRDGPAVDGIYVSGTSQGVTAHVKRTGTAGTNLAPMITDGLITANIAAQQRGLSVLGQAGAKHLVQISMPVLTGASQPGVLDVGQLVQINDSTPWRGRVRSVGVQASMPSVRQTVSLERHLA